jgi:hypothetical protein
MSPRRRVRARGTGVMVLDNEGVSKAATDRAMYVRLKVAHDDGHRVLTSAAVLAEVLRGTSRDAGLHRVLARVAVEPVSEAIGQQAGHLIGAAGMSADQVASIVIVTSDLPHLTKLVAARPGFAVVHVSKLGSAS